MPAITGNEYINRINKLNSNIWVDGVKVKGNISEHPAFKGVIKSQAKLYDMQHDDQTKKIMTYKSPTSGHQVGTSYMPPKTKDDLVKRRQMIQYWAKAHGGMMGRSPDYMNTVLMSLAASVGFLRDKDNCFPDNLIKFYEEARENDLSFSHTFINPQVNRSQLYFEESEEPIAAKVMHETKDGLIVKGARLLATQGGMTDEILVFSPGGITDQSNAFAFSIPSNTEGLKFICRESFVNGESSFNYPLSSRFEEIDSIVVFDNVLVPWERVFFHKNLKVANSFKNSSAFMPFTLHQVLSRQIVKSEFVLGVAQSIVQTINSGEYQHVQEKLSEIIISLETLKALLSKAEEEAQIDEFGLMRPNPTPLFVAINTFPKIYPRMIEIIQQLGTSGLLSIPTDQAFQSEISNDLERYLQSATLNAKDRVKLFRLAWDLTMSGFGTRQTQYERYFFGDPVRLSSELYFGYNKKDCVDWVHEFIKN
ncbi:4-hydroxyphenylacetate 3-monooxygenase, oxygenase component [Aquibacillus halophilus]|uniref:4-hydroxyphenylacetate 3-monooxygenase, oxygenase component n=1 Tax=Aquibacillus halophilus TaxID=930132 RepID=A0A6A8DIR8_9BACI|nr:4-hydroxyphenylacetate 3-monooxygenase, oxygenase component [Aquibacillus halophilus]MRH45150.1 4-hydroxyphenylacetate 3-monooxygenase, oxygenase component [Aquibacillus halophilus]